MVELRSGKPSPTCHLILLLVFTTKTKRAIRPRATTDFRALHSTIHLFVAITNLPPMFRLIKMAKFLPY